MSFGESVRWLSRQGWFVVLTGVITALGTGFLIRHLWAEWTLFAMFGVGSYVFLFREMPWRTPLRKSVAIGVFVGVLLPTIEWANRALT